ncbi:HAD-like domain-containing protein [Jimgerdemannia flammicorona]|uniref:Mitochondrial import inner membrane translocase subunit TIM50 n=1 Tax=Jimgerdemannia flammicorona TaxID=994334 RepID=A0A433DG34_9FUNG|nr:HAD-like domain-containing protein [Jimgerdemannia flammicorona]
MNDNWPSLRWRLKYCRANGKPLLPKKTDDKLTVVLDLDETLLHTYHDSDAKPSQLDYSVAVPVPLPIPDYDAQCVVHGSLRPGVTQFLEWAASMFELVVWTAGTKWYAEAIVNKLDPERRLISHVLSQKHCIELEVISGVACYLKDLELLGRDLRRTVIVDNTPHAATFNLSNLIPIESFFGCEEDQRLDRLKQFLAAQQAAGEKDIRLVLHRQLDLKRRLRHKVAEWVEEEEE